VFHRDIKDKPDIILSAKRNLLFAATIVLIYCDADLNIQCTILDGTSPTAEYAVSTLKRQLLPPSAGATGRRKRRRRDATSQPLFVLNDMYNQSLTPAKVISWTGETGGSETLHR
jgi:hypothetical protein